MMRAGEMAQQSEDLASFPSTHTAGSPVPGESDLPISEYSIPHHQEPGTLRKQAAHPGR